MIVNLSPHAAQYNSSTLSNVYTDATTFGWIMTCLAKLTLHMGVYSPEVNTIMDRYRTGFPAELRQVCVGNLPLSL